MFKKSCLIGPIKGHSSHEYYDKLTSGASLREPTQPKSAFHGQREREHQMNEAQINEWLESIKTNIMSGDIDIALQWIEQLKREMRAYEIEADLQSYYRQERG